jgi:hypothetical protein
MSDDTLRPRLARPADYAHFVRLARELGSGGSGSPASDWVDHRDDADDVGVRGWRPDVVGYTFVQPLVRTGYVRHVVIAPTHRGRRPWADRHAGRSEAPASPGVRTDWCLHVIGHEHPRGASVRTLRDAARVHFAIHSDARGPSRACSRAMNTDLTTRRIEAQDDEAVEAAFALARGQLASVRSTRWTHARRPALATQPDETCVAVACFDPRFPGASPFRVQALEPWRGSVARCHPPARAAGSTTHLSVMVENHDALAARLLEARRRSSTYTITHMAGPLPLVTVRRIHQVTRAHD